MKSLQHTAWFCSITQSVVHFYFLIEHYVTNIFDDN